MGKIVIAGAGVTGMMCALKLTETVPASNIVIFDKSLETGGMYNSVSYEDGKVFDHGMHVIYESCNPTVDELYFKVMPPSEWNIHEKNRKDIAGVYFRGQLQNYSHYIDLRSFQTIEKNTFIGSLFSNLNNLPDDTQSSALNFLTHQFGTAIVEQVHKPLLQNLYSVAPEKLDVFAVKATALERVVMFEREVMHDLMKADLIRSRIAFPDQLNLPPYRNNNQRALYPKKFGMRHFIQKLQDKLTTSGVRILTGTSLQQIIATNNRINEITLSPPDGELQKIPVSNMIWTGGWPALASALNVKISDIPFQRGIKIVYVNLILDNPPLMDSLYYFYCYDTGFASFRVTSYSNYCPDAAKDGTYPICVELWPSRLGVEADALSDEECQRIAIEEIRKMGIVNDLHKVVYQNVGSRASEFPLPTIENKQSLHKVRSRVQQTDLSNIIVAGIMAEDGLFFIPDILNDAIAKVQATNFSESAK